MHAPDIVVIGSANRDTWLSVDHIPAPGETVMVRGVRTLAGGKGANQAIAAARLGRSVEFVGCFGVDGGPIRDALTAEGVDLRCCRTVDGCASGHATVLVAPSGENAIVVSAGANELVNADDVDRVLGHLGPRTVVLLQQEIPLETVAHAVGALAGAGRRVILNAAPYRALDRRLLERLAVLVVNAGELAALLGHHGEPARQECIALLGEHEWGSDVIVTLGHDGALVATGDRVWHVDSVQVDVADTVGAGDTFCGALADALFRGSDPVAGARWAAAAGAASVTQHGTQSGMPTAAEVAAIERTIPPATLVREGLVGVKP